MSNLNDGLDIYSLKAENGIHVGEMRYDIDPSDNLEVQCTFANGGKWVISGGTDGRIRIFDRNSNQILQTLQGPDSCRLVQTICVR
jgi:WD40 repeat protein